MSGVLLVPYSRTPVRLDLRSVPANWCPKKTSKCNKETERKRELFLWTLITLTIVLSTKLIRNHIFKEMQTQGLLLALLLKGEPVRGSEALEILINANWEKMKRVNAERLEDMCEVR